MISSIKAIGAYKDMAQSSSQGRRFTSEPKQNEREKQTKSSFDQILHKMLAK